MRTFETMIINMPPEVRAKYIDDYLDWLWEKAWNLGTAPEKEKTARLTNLVDIFIIGKKEADQELSKAIQEAATILVYVIGDGGAESPEVRGVRAQRRRVKLLNIWRAYMGVDPMPLPTTPGLIYQAPDSVEPEAPVAETSEPEAPVAETGEPAAETPEISAPAVGAPENPELKEESEETVEGSGEEVKVDVKSKV